MKKMLVLFGVFGVLSIACPPRYVGGAPDKVLRQNGWTYKVWVTARGTRSEGHVAHLYRYGKEICPRNGRRYISTPFGKMFYKESRYPWGWHGWQRVTGANATSHTPAVAGRWRTNFGTMRLDVKDNLYVTGTYTHDNGKLRGRLQGNRLHCKWFEAPTYRPPKDAGDCLFVFSPDGRSFTGQWRYGYGTGVWDGRWSGTKE